MIRGVVSDFGGVLTTPLMGAFFAFQARSGVPLPDLYAAMTSIGERLGVEPLHELETGRLREADFLEDLGAQLTERLGRPTAMHDFGESYFSGLEPNPPMIELMRELRHAGYRMAICTNNVREWEPLWRAMLPVEEIFEEVIDSAFVGHRKPDPEIYGITLERLGLPAQEVLFVDDVEINCEAARDAGMHAVQFLDNEQAIDEIRAMLNGGAPTGACAGSS
jgi:putative hydrolase of the HAD superfamily